MSTVADRLSALLEAGGAPVKDLDAFGSHVIVTCWSEGAARRVASLLTRGTFKVDAVRRSMDYNAENRGTNLRPTKHEVWRVWAHV